jgi:hypothetical protein
LTVCVPFEISVAIYCNGGCEPNAFVTRFVMQEAAAHVSNYHLNLFA